MTDKVQNADREASGGHVREWLGLRQLTEYAAVSERTIRAWIHAPVDPLPAVQVDRKILVRRRAGYVAVRPVDGWNKSKVFGRSFRLTRKRHHMGLWQYKLAVKPVE